MRADGQLKLLDFGIAKLIDPLLGLDGGAMQTGVIALTPEYAAPEQVRGQPVSTATDTYALGVLLFRLLTGQRPYEVRGHTASEVERIVCDVEPPRPSDVAPEKLRRTLRGDLDVIVKKALHKDPARRYSAASALKDDLRRFRTGLPVQARPDNAAYRFGKFVRRNRAGTAATIVTMLAFAAATAFSTSQAREAQRQRHSALQEVQRQQSMVEVTSVLAGDSRDADGRRLSPVQRIELAAQVLSQEFADQPWLIVEGMERLSGRLYELGEIATADSIVRAAMKAEERLPASYSSGLLMFFHGFAKLRMGELDSADIWFARSTRDTTEAGGAFSSYLARGADSLAVLGRTAAAVDSLALERSAYVGGPSSCGPRR